MRLLRFPSFLLLGGVLLLAGCDMASFQQDADPLATTGDAKLRHWDLLDRDAEAAGPSVRAAAKTGPDSVGVLVTFAEGTDPDMAQSEMEPVFGTLAVRTRKYYRNGFEGAAVVVSEAQLGRLLEALKNTSFVEWIEPDVPVTMWFEAEVFDLAGGQTLPAQIEDTRAHQGPAAAGDGAGDVDLDVFVMDTAVEAHPDLNLVAAHTFHDAPGRVDPLHGTHVAGIIAARDNDFGVVGVAPGARIHSLEVVRPEGYALMSDMIEALEYVLAAKAARPDTPAVLNVSLGAYVGSADYNALDHMIERVIDAGVTVVAASGNDFADAAHVSPAHVDGALTVGAMLGSGHLAPFSNHGAQIDLFARGEAVLSTAPEGRYATMWGTSQATAVASGAAATYLWRNPAASPAEVHAALLDHAKQRVRKRGLPDGTTRAAVYVQHM